MFIKNFLNVGQNWSLILNQNQKYVEFSTTKFMKVRKASFFYLENVYVCSWSTEKPNEILILNLPKAHNK
jgi:hypothetical protein